MALTEDFKLLRRGEGIPAEADFSLVLRDSAMEPLLHPGQTVYVSCRAALRERDVGLFLIDGQVYCRRWCEDYNGALVLLGGAEKDCLYLDREQRRRCLCLGKVLL
ncbi:MAG: hypothetical protein ACI4O0_01160 [Candidatus Limivicinus sp.]